jgi:CHASE3 domain sensor protein
MTLSLGSECRWKRRMAAAIQYTASFIHRHIGCIFLLGLLALVDHGATVKGKVSQCLLAQEEYRNVILGMESAQRGYLITGDAEYKRRYIYESARYSLAEQNLEDCLQSDKVNHDRLLEINLAAQKKIAEMESGMRMYDSGDKDGAFQLVKTDEGLLYSLKINELLDTIRLDTQLGGLSAIGAW